MTIIGIAELDAFRVKHPASRKALSRWELVVESAQWNNLAELKATFSSADYVDGYTVFNIGGNKYRLIALVSYLRQAVQVDAVLTHEEYDRGGWK